LLTLFNSGGRGAIMYRLADDNLQTNPIDNRAFIDAEYNRAFVATLYFGYLRRDADIGGFLFWLDQISHAALRETIKQHAMVCSFITSAEYQQRFGAVVTHTNCECPQRGLIEARISRPVVEEKDAPNTAAPGSKVRYRKAFLQNARFIWTSIMRPLNPPPFGKSAPWWRNRRYRMGLAYCCSGPAGSYH
jgi:hypothetical protein